MRLIDADKLEMKLLFDDSWDMEYPTYGVFQYQLWEAPTVEAIPVEWIKQLLDDAELAGQPHSVNILKRILNRWEKENGTDRQR